MPAKRTIAGFASAALIAGGGTVATDAAINPYDVKADRYELRAESVIEAAGENKIEAHRDRPAVTLSKWGGEAAVTIAYGDINVEGERQFLTDRIEWKAAKEELHAYPLPASEDMEDGGYEIEVFLKEKPDRNVFDFTIEGAENLEFWYQPPRSPDEIAEGVERPENVEGSYAVYHKERANHRLGGTNFATGKAFHIYRPRAFDANGAEVWCDLAYAEGTLSVTCPEKWLDAAAYPVRVDPTFGNHAIGGSTSGPSGDAIHAFTADIPENGTAVSITARGGGNGASRNVQFGIYSTSYALEANTGTVSFSTITQWATSTVISGGALTAGTHLLATNQDGSMFYRFDLVGGVTSHFSNGVDTFGTWPNPWDASPNLTRRYSYYVTYTASGGATPVKRQSEVWFE